MVARRLDLPARCASPAQARRHRWRRGKRGEVASATASMKTPFTGTWLRAPCAILSAHVSRMVPRTSWKGFLRLSLISVPVKAFTANNTSEEIHLNQLHKDCNSRVRYQKVCPEHGELNNEQIVKGYEYAKDQYVVIEPEEIDKLRTKADRSVNIDGFIPQDAIDPVFLSGRTNYLLPDGPAGERHYTLLHEGMVSN